MYVGLRPSQTHLFHRSWSSNDDNRNENVKAFGSATATLDRRRQAFRWSRDSEGS